MPVNRRTKHFKGIILKDEENLKVVFEDASLSIYQGPGGDSFTVKVRNSNDLAQSVAKRRHDISGATRTLRLAINNIKEGYRFDDPLAEKKLEAMDKALSVLMRECEIVKTLLSLESDQP